LRMGFLLGMTRSASPARRSVRDFRFDAVQMPLNVMDAHFRSFEKLVLPELVKQNTGVLAMKTMANGIILRLKTVTPTECLKYALNLPTSVVIKGIDSMEILDQALNAAKTFRPMSEDQVREILEKTGNAGINGEFEPFKITSIFDATAQNPQLLGEEPPGFQELMPS
jgi:aryl-alcohol dehydrogenase-like predicted oxidoreductase